MSTMIAGVPLAVLVAAHDLSATPSSRSMEDGSTLGTILTYVVLAIVLLAIAFGITRAAWFFSMLVAMNLASRRRRAATSEPLHSGGPTSNPALRDPTGPDR